jgi:ankyrin repeat protein
VNAFTEQGYKDVVTAQGKEPTDRQKEVGMNLNRANYKNIKIFFDAIQKKNIYASTQFIETESTNASFAASPDTDTLYLVYNGRNSIQWFYTSHRYGKQIFAYDRSSPTPEGKVQAFVDAVQVQAIRD